MARTYQLQAVHRPSRLGIPYDRELNESQMDVVMSAGGPALVIAGPGSGKTRVLTYRVAYLVDAGVPPQSIVLLTFTNRAARQMLERAAALCGTQGRLLLGGTFHHVANVILREHAVAVGYQPNFTIVDREDAKEVMQAAVGDSKVDVRVRRFPKADVLIDLVSRSLNEQKPLGEVIAREAPHFLSLTPEILEVARRYVMRKVQQNVMDFDDLLMNFKVLLAHGGDVARAVTSRFTHVLVDEFQDTNQLQGEIVDLLGAPHGNIMVVGDDAQSIYGFRGANFANIMEFPERHQGARLFRLEVNYRSTPQVLALANASIRHNHARIDKTLRAVRGDGSLPALVPCADVYTQAAFVAQRVLELRDEGVGLKDMAVLYRAHSHALELQVELTRRGIPFVVRSGLRFFEQAHIKDVISYMRWVHNPREELSLRRAVKLHDGVGNAVAQHVWEGVEAGLAQGKEVRAGLFFTSLEGGLPPRSRRGLHQFGELVDELSRASVKASPQEMLMAILDGGYREYLRRGFPNHQEREIDIEQLAEYAATFASLEEMLSEILLMENISGQDVLAAAETDEKLTLSSIHQAKGLEWSRVFIIWCGDGHLPHDVAMRTLEGEEEERRLFYVATTRAKDELYLCWPSIHRGRDRTMFTVRPSRFLTELGNTAADTPDALWERWQVNAPAPPSLQAGSVVAISGGAHDPQLGPGAPGDKP
jgi:DNA helicase-2/ATP-dependent DNA helicase PcrA